MKLPGHVHRMENKQFVKEAYGGKVEGLSRRARLLVRWKGRGKEYMYEGGGSRARGKAEWNRKKCMEKERWKFCHGHPLWDTL